MSTKSQITGFLGKYITFFSDKVTLFSNKVTLEDSEKNIISKRIVKKSHI